MTPIAIRLPRWLPITFGVAAAIACAPCTASADFIYSISEGNSAIVSYPGPYATVTVHLVDSTHADFTVQALNQGSNNFLVGDGSTVALNVNASTFSLVGSITGTQPGIGIPNAGNGPYTANFGSQNVSEFGHFNFTIDSFDGASHASSTVSFELQNTSGTWASDSTVLTPNDKLFSAADHIFVFNSDYTLNPATGFAGDSGGINPIPEPSTAALSLVGLASLCVRRGCRRWRGR
jgi:hypothetical protein